MAGPGIQDAESRLAGSELACRQRRTVVRVLSENDRDVVVGAYEYRRRDRGPEAQCPFPAAEPARSTVRLRQSLDDRDVRESALAPPLFVADRTMPGRTRVRGTPSCASSSATRASSADYANFIHHRGRAYVNNGLAVFPGTSFGAQVGTVGCRLSESFTPATYRASDGDAAYLDAGTPYFAVKGRPVDKAIGATYNGQRLVFTFDPTLR
jgi:hypothetical protein